MIELSFKNWLLQENTHEKYAFHAIILSGGPGSGKSWVAKKLFEDMGFQRVDSDEIFKMIKKSKLLSDIPLKPNLIDDYKDIKDKERLRSYQISMARSRAWQNTGKPFVIDITGRTPELVNNVKNELNEAGYDVYMVFIDTDLDIALRRNQSRDRKEPEHLVRTYWEDAQKAKEIYRKIFGSKFREISNNTEYSKDQYKDTSRMINGWMRTASSMFGDAFTVENPIGRQKLANYWRVDKAAMFNQN
jgi:adenylate kinase family enzyme